jgi:hypothetical protein
MAKLTSKIWIYFITNYVDKAMQPATTSWAKVEKTRSFMGNQHLLIIFALYIKHNIRIFKIINLRF